MSMSYFNGTSGGTLWCSGQISSLTIIKMSIQAPMSCYLSLVSTEQFILPGVLSSAGIGTNNTGSVCLLPRAK